MVATLVALLVQLPPVNVDVKGVVPATQTVWAPLRVPADGAAVMVTVRVAVEFAQPPEPVTV